jgi:hypothetical protein
VITSTNLGRALRCLQRIEHRRARENAAKLRSWRVSLIRKRVQYLEFATAPDPEASKLLP